MRMGVLRRSTRTRLARLPAGIGCKPIYKTNANGGNDSQFPFFLFTVNLISSNFSYEICLFDKPNYA